MEIVHHGVNGALQWTGLFLDLIFSEMLKMMSQALGIPYGGLIKY